VNRRALDTVRSWQIPSSIKLRREAFDGESSFKDCRSRYQMRRHNRHGACLLQAASGLIFQCRSLQLSRSKMTKVVRCGALGVASSCIYKKVGERAQFGQGSCHRHSKAMPKKRLQQIIKNARLNTKSGVVEYVLYQSAPTWIINSIVVPYVFSKSSHGRCSNFRTHKQRDQKAGSEFLEISRRTKTFNLNLGRWISSCRCRFRTRSQSAWMAF
jgi:hypothetical protein